MKPAPIPPLEVERIGQLWVVRDDKVPGGTKRRALSSLLKTAQEYVYASPASGFAQVALAYAAADVGAMATIFTAKRKELHPNTVEAKAAGARVVLVPTGYLSNVTAKARAFCDATGAYLMPFGFGSESFIKALRAVALRIDLRPKEVWCVAGSGTLAKALMGAWPYASFNVVQIGAELAEFDQRRIRLFKAPEKFEEESKTRPPFPSSVHYDAKAWRFIEKHAQPEALFWNVAG